MMIRRDIVFAVLVTFCLTAMLFMVVPTRSQTTPTYDPWADINEDGKIDVKDIAYSAKLFGTLGDPTKNVTVTNFPSTYDSSVLNWPTVTNVSLANLPLNEQGNLKTTSYQPTGVFNASCEIIVQTTSVTGMWSTDTSHRGIGILETGPRFACAFSPQSENFTTTILCLQMVCIYPGSGTTNVRLYINDVYLGMLNPDGSIQSLLLTVQDPAKCASLRSGVNILRIVPEQGICLQELRLIVGYQYTR